MYCKHAHTASDDVLRICENDVILKHDSVWPHGLNNNLHLGNIVAISEFRKSCFRHHWPPSDGDPIADVTIDVRKVKASLDAHNSALLKKSSTNHNRPEQDRCVLRNFCSDDHDPLVDLDLMCTLELNNSIITLSFR